MEDKGARHLAEALKLNSGLTTLNLDCSGTGNMIGDEGAQHMAEALKMNSVLTTLNLGRGKDKNQRKATQRMTGLYTPIRQ